MLLFFFSSYNISIIILTGFKKDQNRKSFFNFLTVIRVTVEKNEQKITKKNRKNIRHMGKRQKIDFIFSFQLKKKNYNLRDLTFSLNAHITTDYRWFTYEHDVTGPRSNYLGTAIYKTTGDQATQMKRQTGSCSKHTLGTKASQDAAGKGKNNEKFWSIFPFFLSFFLTPISTFPSIPSRPS